MPNLNFEVDEDLLRAIRVTAAAEDMTRRDWIVKRLEDALLTERKSYAMEGATRVTSD